MRSRIVLAARPRESNTEIARRSGCSSQHGRQVAVGGSARPSSRRVARRAAPGPAPDDHRRAGRGGDHQTLETTPKNATHWSTRSMAARARARRRPRSSRIWRAFGLQPHRQETWKLSKDPLFVDKVRDVVGLYLDPPERAVVLCVDEKTQIQALDRTAPILPMLPGTPARPPTTTSATAPPASTPPWTSPPARSSARCTARHRAIEFLKFLQTIDAKSPPTSTCTSCWTTPPPTRPPRSRRGCRAPPLRPALHPDQLLLAQPRRTLVRRTDHQEAAPRHPPLRPRTQRRHPRLDPDLERQPQPYVWTKTADQILDSIARYCTPN